MRHKKIISLISATFFALHSIAQAKDCPAPELEQSYDQLFSDLLAQHTMELAETLNDYRLDVQSPSPSELSPPTVIKEEPFLKKTRALVQAQVGYFCFNKQSARKLFPGGPSYGLEFVAPLGRHIYLFGGGTYFHQNHRESKITLMPFFLGLEQMYRYLDRIDLHLAFGAEYGYWHVKSRPDLSKTAWNFGVLAKGGILLDLSKHFFLDLFADYSFLQMRIGKHEADIFRQTRDVSGWTVGLGWGYRFLSGTSSSSLKS